MIWPPEAYPSRRELCIILSHKCNLNCSYCYVDKSSPNADMISLETAQQAIREAFSEEPYEEVEISFLGGEPLLAFDRMAEIAQWVLDSTWDKPYYLFATVNGTLLNDDMKAWFRERRESFYLCVSYDGSLHAQDANRSNSKDKIDLDFFRENWPNQPVKMTVSEESVPYLAQNVIELHEKGIEMDASIALGTKLWSQESVKVFRSQLDILIDYYIQHPSVTPIVFLRHDLRGVFARYPEDSQYCGAGKQFTAVYLDGRKYPCHLLSPLVVPKDALAEVDALDIWHTTVKELPVCQDCAIRMFCPMCLGMNYKQTGNPANRDRNSCMLAKEQVRACCKFQARLLQGEHTKDPTDSEMAKAIIALSYAMSTHKANS